MKSSLISSSYSVWVWVCSHNKIKWLLICWIDSFPIGNQKAVPYLKKKKYQQMFNFVDCSKVHLKYSKVTIECCIRLYAPLERFVMTLTLRFAIHIFSLIKIIHTKSIFFKCDSDFSFVGEHTHTLWLSPSIKTKQNP